MNAKKEIKALKLQVAMMRTEDADFRRRIASLEMQQRYSGRHAVGRRPWWRR